MPLACHAVAIPLPCRAAKSLDYFFPVWFTQCGRIWYTQTHTHTHTPCRARAMPRPCSSESDISRPRHSAIWAQHSMCELASVVQWRHVGDLPVSASSGYHAEFHESCYQKHTNPLNRRTRSSDISGYQADFHEGQGTVGEWQGRGMACVN
jgi:hypothetical protein